MAVLAIAAAGAGAGGALLGTGVVAFGLTGTGIGWTVGSLLGNALFGDKGQDTEGPRLGDTRVQVSTYGGMIPRHSGTNRTAGNIIELPGGRREHVRRQKAGKGGGPTSTTYSYDCDLMICLSDDAMQGIRKVWNNGELIYDASTGSDIGTILGNSLNCARFTFYDGNPAQLPDPTLEAFYGVGNTPAYRGVTSVFFEKLNLGQSGNLPQLTFEMFETGTAGDNKQSLPAVAPINPNAVIQRIQSWIAEGADIILSASDSTASGDGKRIYSWRVGPGYSAYLGSWPQAQTGYVTQTITPLVRATGPNPQWVGMTVNGSPAGNNETLYIQDAKTGFVINCGKFSMVANSPYDMGYAAYDPISLYYVYAAQADTTNPRYVLFDARGFINPHADMPAFPATQIESGPINFYDSKLWIFGASATYCLNPFTNTLLATYAPRPLIGIGGSTSTIYYVDANGVYCGIFNSGGLNIVAKLDLVNNAWVTLTNNAFPIGVGTVQAGTSCLYANEEYCVVGPALDQSSPVRLLRHTVTQYSTLDPAQASRAAIISKLCDEVGLGASDIDVLEVTGNVWGYPRTRQSSARNNLVPLMSAFSLDAPESDGKLKFKSRGAATTVATIPYDELSAGEVGRSDADPLSVQHGNSDELPSSLTVSYINRNADYENSSEPWIRSVIETPYDTSFESPISQTTDEAATLAAKLGWEAWNERDKYSFSLTRKWAMLDPADVVTVYNKAGEPLSLRLTRVNDDGTKLDVEAVTADPALYTDSIEGTTPDREQTVSPPIAPTNSIVLDIPMLRDADNNAGVYFAMDGYTTDWPGAFGMHGSDLNNLSVDDSVTQNAPMGFTETALNDWQSNTLDYKNRVVFQMTGPDDALASATRTQLDENDANVFAVGAAGRWEIIQVQDFQSLGDGRYVAYNLLRGRKGTEQYAATHQASDRVVWLQPAGDGIIRIPFDLAELNVTKYFKAVTTGDDADDVDAYTDVNTGVALRPYSPVDLRASRGATTTTVTATRRTRIDAEWPDGADEPLGETLEQYVWGRYTSAAFTTLAEAEQTTSTPSVVWATIASPLYVRVQQISSQVGRGYSLQGAI